MLFGVSFARIWATIFLLHRSTALVFAYGDNVAYRDVANAILHWDFRGLQLQRFMGYPYFIAFTNFAVADLAEKPLAALRPSSGLVGSCK